MNTGIMDAYNLARKLALVASGHAPDRLLDSYGQERGPAAADVLALTHALVTLGTMTHPAQRALRKTVIPLASRLAPVHRRAARRMGQLHVSYPSSALTAPAGQAPGSGQGSEHPTSPSPAAADRPGCAKCCAADGTCS
jgi:FAD binding domain